MNTKDWVHLQNVTNLCTPHKSSVVGLCHPSYLVQHPSSQYLSVAFISTGQVRGSRSRASHTIFLIYLSTGRHLAFRVF